jgi:hypothetical protein
MNQFFLLPLTAFLINLFIGSLILLKKHKIRINQLYALFALSSALWAFGDFLNFLSFTTSIFSKYFTITFSALTAVFFLHFILYFSKNSLLSKKRIYVIYVPAFGFIIVNAVSNLIVQNKVAVWWGYASNVGMLYPIFAFYVLVFVTSGIILCIRYYVKTPQKKEKKHAILLIIALVIPLISGIFTQILPRFFQISIIDLTTTSTIFSALIIGYGIFKHEFIAPMSFTYTKKISTLVLVVVVICISFILVPGVTFASESAIDEALENIEYDASTKAEYIELYLEELDHSISSLAESVVLNGLFLAENTSNMNASIQIINQELAMVSKNHIEFDDIELIDKYGVVLASSNASMIGENRRKSTIFHDGMIDITFHDVIKLNTSSSPVFPISKMIIRNNQIKGLVVIYVNPQYLFQYLSETLVLSKTEETYIVDEDGLLLSPTQSPDDIIYATTVDTLIVQNAQHTKYFKDEYSLNPTNPVISYENHRGEKVFGIYRNIHHNSVR